MKRFQVLRRIEVGGVAKLVRAGSCDALDATHAVKKIAHYCNLPVSVLEAREVHPLAPVGNRPLNGEKP